MPKLKLESLILVVFFASVVLLGYRKCSANRASYVNKDSTKNVDYSVDRPARLDTLAGIEGGVTKPQTYSAPPITPSSAPSATTKPITTVTTAPKKKPSQSTTTVPPVQNTNIPTKPINIKQPATTAPITQPVKTSGVERSVLFITINRLKLRAEPGLKSKVLGRLKLHEKVYFAGERTDYKEEISLGYAMANEPWVKVETQRGTIGWVYGAGVDIMKTVRDGVRQ